MIHVLTIDMEAHLADLTDKQWELVGDRLMTVVATMLCEVGKGEKWTGKREVWIAGNATKAD